MPDTLIAREGTLASIQSTHLDAPCRLTRSNVTVPAVRVNLFISTGFVYHAPKKFPVDPDCRTDHGSS